MLPLQQRAFPVTWRRVLLGVTCLAFLILANGSPDLVPVGTASDKLNHVLVFAVLTPLAVWAFPLTSILMVFLGLTAFNATIEFTQGILGQGRYPDTLDWLMGVAVSATILLPIALLHRRASRRS